MFQKYKRFVETGLWTKTMVDNIYKKGAVTEEEYKELIALFN